MRREQNEAIATAIRACSNPSRFQWMGSVPMQSAEQAIAELEYAVRSLGMVGVEIGSEIDGRELDDPSFQDFWSAVVENNVPVFVHPTSGPNVIRRGGVPYEFAIGMTTDTAMAATALVFGGVLERNPGLRVGLAHGCGTFPWAYPRIARGSTLGKGERIDDVLRRTDELVKTLWADTLVFDPLHLGVLKERFGADHLMLGSDFPFYPDDWGHCTSVIDGALANGTCTDEEASAIRGANRAVDSSPARLLDDLGHLRSANRKQGVRDTRRVSRGFRSWRKRDFASYRHAANDRASLSEPAARRRRASARWFKVSGRSHTSSNLGSFTSRSVFATSCNRCLTISSE